MAERPKLLHVATLVDQKKVLRVSIDLNRNYRLINLTFSTININLLKWSGALMIHLKLELMARKMMIFLRFSIVKLLPLNLWQRTVKEKLTNGAP